MDNLKLDLKIEKLQYDLERKIPDMILRGFTVQTTYGELEISPDDFGFQTVVNAVGELLGHKLAMASLKKSQEGAKK